MIENNHRQFKAGEISWKCLMPIQKRLRGWSCHAIEEFSSCDAAVRNGGNITKGGIYLSVSL
jgi:hypothetical protein